LIGAASLALLLLAPPANGFVGSARCGQCHKLQHERWQADWHRRALAPATSASVIAAFAPGTSHGQGASLVEMSRDASGFSMTAAGRDGTRRSWPAAWAIGGRRMQDFLTPFPDGRLQVLPVYWHATKSEWVDYTTLKQGPLDRQHPFFWTNYARTFNKECLACHVTGEEIGWNEAKGVFETTWKEPGVACERCHGAGGRHAKAGTAATIVRPTALPPDRGAAICASCHSLRAPHASAFSSRATLRPGQAFDEVYEPLTPILGPHDLSGDFFLDGRPSVGSMESTALAQSACARKGGVTCFTCHTAPHGKGGLSEMKPAARTDEVCLTCHPSLARKEHTFHAAGTPGSRCVDCHMPATVVGVLDPQRDHAIGIPVPENARDFDIPDACASCHAVKGPEWAIAQLASHGFDPRKRGPRIRLARATSAWKAQSLDAEPALLDVLADRTVPELLRANAASGLGSVVRSPSARDATEELIRALDDPSLVVATRAARSLGMRMDRSGADALARAVSSRRDPLAQSAAMALLDLDLARGTRAVATLLRRATLAKDHRLSTAMAIVELRRGNAPEAVRRLEAAIADRPDYVNARQLLADVLRKLGRIEEAKRQDERARLFRHDPGKAH